MCICVLSRNGIRLMPTIRPGRVRHLLKDGKAIIVKHKPFTIQLLYDSPEFTQPIEFCQDTGDHHIGVSIKGEKREYASAEYLPLKDEKARHDTCRQLRRQRRSRLRYRKPRFNNRRGREGYLPPSVEHKGNLHLSIYEKYLAVAPITQAVFEVGSFDTQKLQAIEDGRALPEGKGYQQGPCYNFETLRAAVFQRDSYKCCFCGKGAADGVILHTHHYLYWKGRHGNQLNELATACNACHTPEAHKQSGRLWGVTLNLNFRNMAGASTMNQLRWYILNGAKAVDPSIPVKATHGADTNAKRKFLGLVKSHVNDAFAMGNFHPAERAPAETWQKKRRNNRILEKFYDAKYIDARDGQKRSGQELYSGRMRRNLNLRGENLHKYRKERVSKGHRSIRRRRYPLRPGDTIRFENHLFKVKGVQHNGEWVALASGKSVPCRKVIPVCHTGGWAKG